MLGGNSGSPQAADKKPRAITSKLRKRVIGEVEVEQHGRQTGKIEVEDRVVGFTGRQLRVCVRRARAAAAVAEL